MVTYQRLIVVCVLYVLLLFVVAFLAERQSARGRGNWLRTPMVYTLSLSVYCTAWTFYGAVGNAARTGLEYLTIYLGPTLVLVGWWALLRRLVRIGRSQRITSIADLISSRFGKSTLLGVIVTLLAVCGTTPYIALQLQSVAQSMSVFASAAAGPDGMDLNAMGLWVAIGLAVFTIMFGTRNLDVNERHNGVVTAIALEAVVKLCALVAVGGFVVWGISDGPADVLARIDASAIAEWQVQPGRWVGLTTLSMAAFLCLPRMFQVLVVENLDEGHLRHASWAFPLYMLAMSLFVLPIAVVGLQEMPSGSNPDLFVLTLPLSQGQGGLALLAFLGGFSSATSMVIIAAIALSTMVSNHIVMPIWLKTGINGAMISGDVRRVVLQARRLSIIGVLGLGYLYFRLSGAGAALASIGLIAFVGVAQILPAMLAGIFWRGAMRTGAATGLLTGFAIWAYTLFLPSFGIEIDLGAPGTHWLHPRALFGIAGMEPVLHTLLWSLLLNTGAVIIVSIFSFPNPMERLQGAQFVDVFAHSTPAQGWSRGAVGAEDLLLMTQRILGTADAQRLFQAEAKRQGLSGYLPEITPVFIEQLERRLAGSVGGATAHAMVGQIVGGASVSVQDLMAVADETAQMMEYSSQLEAKSDELERTARQLREANSKLMQISIQKDAFLSQISHELRTPMTSIRAFSEILRETDLSAHDQNRYAGIINDEAQRLTRLLDDLLDLSVLENGQVSLNLQETDLKQLLDRAIQSAAADRLRVVCPDVIQPARIRTDPDRLSQVFLNLITNARKYCDADRPRLQIETSCEGAWLHLDFIDNGSGIPAENQALIFEKFSRLSDQAAAGGAGLGLAICREIMKRLGGAITYVPGRGGAAFRVSLPLTDGNRTHIGQRSAGNS